MSCKTDLTLDEALADPLIGAALRADGLAARDFETTLRAAARRIGQSSGQDRPAPALPGAALAAIGPTRTGAPPARLGRIDDPRAVHPFGAAPSEGFQMRRCTGAVRRAAGDCLAW